jgi:hypothetical protein
VYSHAIVLNDDDALAYQRNFSAGLLTKEERAGKEFAVFTVVARHRAGDMLGPKGRTIGDAEFDRRSANWPGGHQFADRRLARPLARLTLR